MVEKNLTLEDLSGPEFLFGIIPYNGARFEQYSGRKFFIHPSDYLGDIFVDCNNQFNSQMMGEIVKIVSSKDFKLDHCHLINQIKDYPPMDRIEGNEFQDGDLGSIIYSSGGQVIYELSEIKHRGLINSLNAGLLLEVFTQWDLIEYEQEVNQRSQDYSRWLENINRRFHFP